MVVHSDIWAFSYFHMNHVEVKMWIMWHDAWYITWFWRHVNKKFQSLPSVVISLGFYFGFEVNDWYVFGLLKLDDGYLFISLLYITNINFGRLLLRKKTSSVQEIKYVYILRNFHCKSRDIRRWYLTFKFLKLKSKGKNVRHYFLKLNLHSRHLRPHTRSQV